MHRMQVLCLASMGCGLIGGATGCQQKDQPHPAAVEPASQKQQPTKAVTQRVQKPAAKPQQLQKPVQPQVESKDSPESMQVVFRAAWGSQEQELGHRPAAESAPEGPASFFVAQGGQIYVLDQVNQRVLVFGQRSFRTIKIPSATFEDIVVDKKGNLWLLDRLVQKAVVRLDQQGQLLGRIDLLGEGVAEGGGVTALEIDAQGIWVEVEHKKSVLLATADGRVAQRRSIPGRLSADGRLLLVATLSELDGVAVWQRDAKAPGGTSKLFAKAAYAPLPLFLAGLYSDKSGRVVVGMRLKSTAKPQQATPQYDGIVVFDSLGKELKRLQLAAGNGDQEQFRYMRLGADGALYQLRCDTQGAVMTRVVL